MLTEDVSCCLCTRLRKATRAVTQRYDAGFRKVGLRATQVSVLVALERSGPVRINQLAELTTTDRTTLTRNLGLLVKRGFIAFEQGKDKRAHQARLTPQGLAAIKRAAPQWKESQKCMVSSLGAKRLEDLLQGLDQIIELNSR